MQNYQGDVSLLKGVKAPKELKFKKLTKPFVVRLGEVTGHKHTITANKNAVISYAEYLNEWYLKIDKGGAVITHEEHAPIKLDEGEWFIGKQWEYDELEKMREVQD